MSDLYSAMSISGHGMRAQTERVRIISENIANADTAPSKPGENPYARQTITFKNELDRANDQRLVKVDKVDKEKGDKAFVLKYMPDHPAADEQGYVKMPNVKTLIEMMDMREAQRSYEANLNMFDQSRSMMSRTINLLQ